MPLRVTHIIPVYAPAWQYGGPVRSVSLLCEGLAKRGVDVRVITTNAGLTQDQCSELKIGSRWNGVPVDYYPIDPGRSSIYSTQLISNLESSLGGIDIVHLSTIWQPMGPAVQRIAKRMNIPVLQSLRGALGPYSWSHGWWKKAPYYILHERHWLKKAAALHITSSQEEEELQRLGIATNYFSMPNPIDLGGLHRDPSLRQEIRGKLNIAPEERVLLICGRHHHKKGIDLLPDVLKSINLLQWRILVVGLDEDGSGRLFAKQMVKNGLGSRMLTLPLQPAEELCKIYNASDLLLFPSRHENFGNVVLEALACGCQVLVSDTTGVARDLLQFAPSGYGGVLPRVTSKWVKWLQHWFLSPEIKPQGIRSWLSRTYSPNSVAKIAVQHYEQILLEKYASKSDHI